MSDTPITIPVYQPSLSGSEKKYVMDCLDSNWISSKGKYVGVFRFCKSQRSSVHTPCYLQ